MRIHLALQIGAHRLELRDVDGDAGAAAGGRPLGDVEHAPRWPATTAATRAVEGGRWRRGWRADSLAGRPVEQLERRGPSRPARPSPRRRADRPVRPGERAVRVAQPDRLRDGVEQAGMARRSSRAVGEFARSSHQLAPVAGHVAQAQDGAAADGAALASMKRWRWLRSVRRKPSPRSLQGLERALERGGVRGREPGAEGERPAAAVAPSPTIGGIALEARLAVAAAPAHDELPLGADQQLGAVVGAAQASRSRRRGARSRAAPAGALVQVAAGTSWSRRRRGPMKSAEIDGVVRVEGAAASRVGVRLAATAIASAGAAAAAPPPAPRKERDAGEPASVSTTPPRSDHALPSPRPCRAALAFVAPAHESPIALASPCRGLQSIRYADRNCRRVAPHSHGPVRISVTLDRPRLRQKGG